MANVTVIPAKPRQELQGLEATAKLRVCAYCRVSTDNEEQLSSYEAQVSHYTDYIKRNQEWAFGGIYRRLLGWGSPTDFRRARS